MLNGLLITSGFSFEGYEITNYCGICSGESALGTGFLSSFGASVADFVGGNSEMYSNKLKQAKNFALDRLVENAKRLSADAIIGLDIDYVSFSYDIMGVIASGTAVKIRQSQSSAPGISKILIANHNPDLEFRPMFLSIISRGKDCALQLTISSTSDQYAVQKVSALSADIVLTTIFEDEYIFRNVGFINFSSALNANGMVSSETFCQIPREIMHLIKFGKVIIKKYVENNMLKVASDNDQLWFSSQLPEGASTDQAQKTGFDVDNYILSISGLKSVKEIIEYTHDLNQSLDGMISPELFSLLEENLRFERMYGNFHDSCVRKVKEFFGISS